MVSLRSLAGRVPRVTRSSTRARGPASDLYEALEPPETSACRYCIPRVLGFLQASLKRRAYFCVSALTSAARRAPVAGDFTPATSGGTASNAGVDDLVKELQDAGARLAAEVKAETQK